MVEEVFDELRLLTAPLAAVLKKDSCGRVDNPPFQYDQTA